MAIVVVQHKFVSTIANQNFADVTVDATTAGSLLTCGAICDNLAINGVAFSDGTNAFTAVAAADAVSGTKHSTIWYLPSAPAGKTTVRVTFAASGVDEKQGFVCEVTGFTTPVVDTQAGLAGTGVGTVDTGPAVVTTVTNTFIAAVIQSGGGSITESPAAGNEFTSGGDAGTLDGGGCSLIAASAGSHTPVWTDSASGRTFASSVVAFKESSGAPAAPVSYKRGVAIQQRIG